MDDEEDDCPGRLYHEELEEGPGGGAFEDEDDEGPGRLEGSGSGWGGAAEDEGGGAPGAGGGAAPPSPKRLSWRIRNPGLRRISFAFPSADMRSVASAFSDSGTLSGWSTKAFFLNAFMTSVMEDPG